MQTTTQPQMSDYQIKRAMVYVQSHAFSVVEIVGGVSICIPYTDTITRAQGVQWFDCYTYNQVRIALGY